jgi:hypothetical protein
MAGTDGVQRFAVLAIAAAAAGAVAVLTGFAGADGPADRSVPASFRLEDGSAACARLESGAIACRARDGEASVVIEPDGSSHPADIELRWDDSTPVLLGAESWWDGDVRCRVGAGALSCARAGGAIFVDAGGIGGIA